MEDVTDIAALKATIKIKDELLDEMQEIMWEKLNIDLRNARNGYWSMSAESTVYKIVKLARHRGVTPAGSIQVPLLKSGVYSAVCERLGVKSIVDFDLDRYHDYWGPWEQLARSVQEIRKMDLEDADG